MKKITIDPVTRIEGHAKIDIYLDDAGRVADTHFHVTQVRGFEKFTEGRPYYEMPSITARICGICPVSHLLASAKACDAIMTVVPPETGIKLRELVHCAQYVQSHALSFFHLSAPDFLLGFDSDPARRNVFGLIAEHPEAARSGVALRKFGQEIIEGLAKERIHPSWIVPGGVNAPLAAEVRDRTLAGLPAARSMAVRTLEFFKSILDHFDEEIASFGTTPTMYAGLVDDGGGLQWYDGLLQFKDAESKTVAAGIRPRDYAQFIGEAALKDSYLKAPYFKPIGYPNGVYRVGPLARLNVADACNTPEADRELAEFRQRCGRPAHSAFHYHYARLIELLHALEKIEILLNDPDILDPHVRFSRRRELSGRRRNDRSAARRADPPLQGGRNRRDPSRQPDCRHRPQQPGHQWQRGPSGQALCRRHATQGGHAEPHFGGSARVRSVPELRDPRGRHNWHGSEADRAGRRIAG